MGSHRDRTPANETTMGNAAGQQPPQHHQRPSITSRSTVRDGEGRVVVPPSSAESTRDSIATDPLQQRFIRVWNQDKHDNLRAMYDELNEQATLASYSQALAPIAELNKQSADGLMKIIEDLKEEANKIESQLMDEGQRAQIRRHFESQVDQMRPLMEKLLLNHNEQMKILEMHQDMINSTAK